MKILVFRRPAPASRVLAGLVAAAALVVAVASCNKVTPVSQNKVEDFTGTLDPGGTKIFPFTAANNGEYSIIIKSMTPDSNAPMGVGYGVPDSAGNCAPFGTNSPVTVGFGMSGAINQGNYCAFIFDAFGALTRTQNFVLEVSHP